MTQIMTAVPMGGLFGLVEFRLEFFLTIFNMLVLFLFLRWKLFGPVTEFMNQRSEKIKATIAEADSINDQANQLKGAYEDKLTHIKDEELEILKNARIAAEARTAEMIKEAQQKIEDMKLKAQKDIDQEREKAISRLKDDIAGLAILAASKVVDKEIDQAKHGAMIDDIIERVGDVKWHN